MKRNVFDDLWNSLKEKENVTKWLLLGGVTLIFVAIHYPNLVPSTIHYKVGDVVEKDIKAKKDFLVEDMEATEANRNRAMEEVLPVFDHDTSLLTSIAAAIHKAFDLGRKNLDAEKALQQQTLQNLPSAEIVPHKKTSEAERFNERKSQFEQVLGIKLDTDSYGLLEKEGFGQRIEDAAVQILTTILDNGVIANKDLLLRELDRGILLRDMESGSETILLRLKSIYGLDQARSMVRIVGSPVLNVESASVRNLVVELAQNLIQPNIAYNRRETEERRKRAYESTKPVLYQIKAGEMLLREGERVNAEHLIKLNALRDQDKTRSAISSVVGSAMIMAFLLSTAFILLKHLNPSIRRDADRNLLFLASVLITFFLLVRVSFSFIESVSASMPYGISAFSLLFAIPLPAAAMTICLFMGMNTASIVAVILAAASALLFQGRFEIMFFFLMNSLMAAYCMKRCRERKVFIRAGFTISLLNIGLATAICLYEVRISAFDLIWSWTFAFLGGILTGIVSSGIAPMFEWAFGYTTDISLLELANLDRPILRRLLLEAPGTYHHSVIVGSMVEAAASEIGANPLLAKVCGYYHDIGKIRKPLYFIENQAGGKNRHDKLAPSMSKRILAAHVKDGVEMAREIKLGQAIIDTIQQHHGTSLMRFFYEKAKQQKSDQDVNPDDFRYPGPKPQTREAGLVMLADVVEAASRTLDYPTPARIQGLVQNLINKVFSDGQLDDCELTLRDLHSIAKVFTRILNAIHHHRIEYPDQLVLIGGKSKDGRIDQQPPKTETDPPKGNPPKSAGHLKRLGIS
jgi:hypothetical protein